MQKESALKGRKRMKTHSQRHFSYALSGLILLRHLPGAHAPGCTLAPSGLNSFTSTSGAHLRPSRGSLAFAERSAGHLARVFLSIKVVALILSF